MLEVNISWDQFFDEISELTLVTEI